MIVRSSNDTTTSSVRSAGARAVAELTNELKNLSADEIRSGNAKYKQLLEERELEATLYGAG